MGFLKDLPASALVDRRQFTALLAAVGVSSSRSLAARTHAGDPETLQLSRNAWVPNNDHLPVLIYTSFRHSPAPTRFEFRTSFLRNGWPPQWRNGIYDFHHYTPLHTRYLESLQAARVVLGGPAGHELTLNAGDIVVLPHGTGHCRLTYHPISSLSALSAAPVLGHLPKRSLANRTRSHVHAPVPRVRPAQRFRRPSHPFVAPHSTRTRCMTPAPELAMFPSA